MSTDKRFTRRSFLTGLAAVLAGTSLMTGLTARAGDIQLGSPGVYNLDQNKSDQPVEPQRKLSPDYTLEDFKGVYGNREWDSLPEANRKNVEDNWSKLPLEQRKSSCEFYQSSKDYKAKLDQPTQKAIERAYDAAFWMHDSENKKNWARKEKGETINRNKIKIPIFRSDIDIKQVKAEYLQSHPEINPESLTDFYRDLTHTDLILLNELTTYKGKRLNPEYLRQQKKVPYN